MKIRPDQLEEILLLVNRMTADVGNTCYISFYGDGSGWISEEVEGFKDRLLLDFTSPDSAITEITDWLSMDTGEDE